jgi:metal-sulfur cluster biosynthetic enzyme
MWHQLMETEPQTSQAAPESAAVAEDLRKRIWGELRGCFDPEIPLNIVDLGLVYDVSVTGSQANVKMTLTSPGCHLGGQIAGNVQEKLLALEQIEEANVELVWDPPWHQSMISEEGRKTLGLDAS